MHAGVLGTVSALDSYFFRHSAGSMPRAPEASCRPCEPRPAAEDGATAATLRYRRTERTALYIQTQEGDVVKLRIKVRDALSAAVSGSSTDESPSDISVTSRNTLKISFSVEGDLNADELAAIRSVVEQASTLAADFFDGDLPKAFANAAALDIDAAQLARVGLKLSVRVTYAASGTYQATQFAAQPPATTPAPTTPAPTSAEAVAEAAAAPAALEAPSAPTETADTASVVAAEPAVAEEPAATDTPAAAAAPLPVATQVLATIADFLGRLLDALAAPPTAADDVSPASLGLSLKLRIYSAVLVDFSVAERANASDDTEAQAMPVVVETLDALAAAQQPLDTLA